MRDEESLIDEVVQAGTVDGVTSRSGSFQTGLPDCLQILHRIAQLMNAHRNQRRYPGMMIADRGSRREFIQNNVYQIAW